MQYIFIAIMLVVIILAVLKQNSFKGKMDNVRFYGEESLEIAKTIIPSTDEITLISCGANLDTQSESMFKASVRSSITKSRTQDFKYQDYYVVAKTIKEIFFIPVKIVGTRKLVLQINPKMKTKTYALNNIQQEVLKHSPKNTFPSIDIKFSTNSNTSHSVQFYDSLKNLDIWLEQST